ncbi:MAG: eL32 family ribosomal protein [Nanoarchaeota archaeon]
MVSATLLKFRNEAKSRKPDFVVKESHNTVRVKRRWRFPRGRHSKVRQMHRGRPALPHPGYGSPQEVRGLHRTGLEVVVVNNSRQISVLRPKEQGAVIASGVGARKKLDLLRFAKEKGITVINVKNVESAIGKITSLFEERKKTKKEKQAVATKKEEEKKKKADEKAKKETEEKAKKKAEEGAEQIKSAEKTAAGKEAGEQGAKSEERNKEEPGERELNEREKQKEMVEKTITKRQ